MRLPLALTIGLVLVGLGPVAATTGSSTPLVLERMVLVMRHGVRSPTQSPEALSKLTPQPWPRWAVAPGFLTDHGREDVRIMGAWLRAYYGRRGLWAAKGCPSESAVYAWADGEDQRTRASGQAVLDGAFPGCGLVAHHGPDGAGDPLFSATSQGACPIDLDRAREAVLARVGGDLNHPAPGYGDAKAALAKIVMGDSPCTDQNVCVLAGSNDLKPNDDGVKVTGPLAIGSTMAENLVLEYAEGMPADAVGWGRAGSGRAIASAVPMHTIETDLMRRTPYLAAHNGALMTRAVLAGLQGGAALPEPGAGGGKLTLIAGHDTNVSNLAGVLGADWTLPGQPDKTPPDGALAFEVWKNPMTGARFVRVAMIYQTLEDLRASTPLNAAHPAGRVAVSIPGCADGPKGECRLETFVSLIGSRLPAECVLKR